MNGSTKHYLKIKRLVFSGGGARGLVFIGAYFALLRSLVFDDVEQIAGTSAGAITAAFLAAGITPSELKKELADLDLTQMLGEKTSILGVERDGEPLYEFIKRNINNSIYTRLLDIKSKHELDEESTNIFKKLKREGSKASITFRELKSLKKNYPTHFKELTVTAVKAQGGALKLFNAEDTPDVEVALACKASAAIPGLLEGVFIDGEQYYDGGTYDNIPTESFDKSKNDDYINSKPEETLVFAFLEGQPRKKSFFAVFLAFFSWSNPLNWRNYFTSPALFNALHGSRKDEVDPNATKPKLYNPYWFETVGRNHGPKLLTKLKFVTLTVDYTQSATKEAGYQRIREKYPLRTVGMNVESLLPIDFARATKIKESMITSGYLDTMNMIYNHELGHEQDEDFFIALVDSFIPAYTQQVQSQEKNPAKNALIKILNEKINSSTLSKYYAIQDYSREHPQSLAAQTLALVVNQQVFATELKDAFESHKGDTYCKR